MGRLQDAAALVIQVHFRRHLADRKAKHRKRAAIKVATIGLMSPAKRKFKKLRRERTENRAATKVQTRVRIMQAKQLLTLHFAARKIQQLVRRVQAQEHFQALKDARLRSFIHFATRIQSFGRRFMAQKQLDVYKEARKQRTKAASKAIGQLTRDLHVRDTMITLNRERTAAARQRAAENQLYVLVSFMESWLIRIVFMLAITTLLTRIMPETTRRVLHNPTAIFQAPSTIIRFNTSTDFPKTKSFPSFPIFDAASSSSSSSMPMATSATASSSRRKNNNRKSKRKNNNDKKQQEGRKFNLFKLFDPNAGERSRVIEPYYFAA